MQHETLESALESLHLLKHPFYQDWMAGKLSAGQLRDYACQYFTHVDAFPRYLGAAHSLCADASLRKIILENLNDEEGLTHGKPHPELWLAFAKGMGAGRAEVESTLPRAAIQNVVSTFFRLSRSSLPSALGALYAYEQQVPEIAQSKIEGLKERYGVSDAATLEFFEAHKTADLFHREALKQVLDQLPAAEQAEAKLAAREAAQSLWNFLTDVHGQNYSAA